MAGAGILALSLAWPAQAMTLTNRDATDLIVAADETIEGGRFVIAE